MEFERQVIEKRIDKVRDISDRLPLMQDAHSEYVLLRSWLSLPKLMFTLRTTFSMDHLPAPVGDI